MSITILVIRPKKGSRKKQAGGAWQRRFLMQIWKFCHSGSTGIIGSLMFSVAPSERTLQEFSKNTWKPKFLHYSPYRWSPRSEEHTSELQSRGHLVCRLLLQKKNTTLLP